MNDDGQKSPDQIIRKADIYMKTICLIIMLVLVGLIEIMVISIYFETLKWWQDYRWLAETANKEKVSVGLLLSIITRITRKVIGFGAWQEPKARMYWDIFFRHGAWNPRKN